MLPHAPVALGAPPPVPAGEPLDVTQPRPGLGLSELAAMIISPTSPAHRTGRAVG